MANTKEITKMVFQYVALAGVIIGGIAIVSAGSSYFRRKKAEEDVVEAKEDIEKAEEIVEEVVEEFRGGDNMPTYKGVNNFGGDARRNIWSPSPEGRVDEVANAAGRYGRDIWQTSLVD